VRASVASSGGDRSCRCGGCEHPASRKDRAAVVEEDHPVAQQTPPLLRMCRPDVRSARPGRVSRWTRWDVFTHGAHLVSIWVPGNKCLQVIWWSEHYAWSEPPSTGRPALSEVRSVHHSRCLPPDPVGTTAINVSKGSSWTSRPPRSSTTARCLAPARGIHLLALSSDDTFENTSCASPPRGPRCTARGAHFGNVISQTGAGLTRCGLSGSSTSGPGVGG